MRAAVGLAEGFENHRMLLRRDADAGVADFERHLVRTLRADAQHDAAVLRELEGVGQQVREDLPEPLPVRRDRLGCQRRHVDSELEPLLRRHGLERPRQGVHNLRRRDRLRMDLDGAGFDLRQIQNVVDERQQTVSGRVDRLRVPHVLRRQPARPVLGEQLGENQRAVQRRSQFVRHVGEELGLVLTGALGLLLGDDQRVLAALELLRLRLQLCVRRFEFRLLLLEADLRRLQDFRMLLQFLVGDPQFFLLHAKRLGLTLRFFEQRAKPVAEKGHAHAHRNGVAGPLEEIECVLRWRVHEPCLEDALQAPDRS